MLTPPRVSVITSVYNGERFLAQTVESILAQTWTDFEYIILDDASQDSSPEIVERYAAQDRRILFLRRESNAGTSVCLNQGLKAAHGEFVANLDHDDLAMPERLARQIAFLDQHPNIGVLGSFFHTIDETNQVKARCSAPIEPAIVRWVLLFQCSVLHSTAVMRRALLEQVGGYAPRNRYATDYELLFRLDERTDIANLSDDLAAYRGGAHQTSKTRWRIQHGEVLLLLYGVYKKRLGIQASLQDIEALYGCIRKAALPDPSRVDRAADLLELLYRRYVEMNAPAPEVMQRMRRFCAFHLLRFAHVHRVLDAELYPGLVQRALRFDAALFDQPKVKMLLAEQPVAETHEIAAMV